jgi:hypothetical protein
MLPAGPAADLVAPGAVSNGDGPDHLALAPAEPSAGSENEVHEPEARFTPEPGPVDLPAWDFTPQVVHTAPPAREQLAEDDPSRPGNSPSLAEAAIPLSREPGEPDLAPLEPQPELAPPSSADLALAPVARLVAPVAVPVQQDPVVLEQRIRRLEDTLARLLAQPNANPGRDPAGSAPVASVAAGSSTGSSLISAAAVAGVFNSVGQLFTGGKSGSGKAAVGAAVRRPSWLNELVAKIRAVTRMYVDPRYRMSWVGRILPPTLLAAFVLSKWWIPFAAIVDRIPLAGPVIVLVLQVPVELVVAYGFFKALGYEARRYREKAPDLPTSLRL